MRDSREKGAGMRDQDPPFQTLMIVPKTVTNHAEKYEGLIQGKI